MKKVLIVFSVLLALSIVNVTLSAQNRYDYKMDNIQAKHYIDASRLEVKKNNLSMACAYAKKAVQANSWSKEAWANYDDIVKRLINKGKVRNYKDSPNTVEAVSVQAPAPAPSPTPKASSGASLFEGC